jgi:predicted amidohydrolase YtcJ
VKVGTDAEVLEFAGNAPGVRIIDLHGHTATPGLIDTHAHIADGGVEELYGIKLSITSVAEIVARAAKIVPVKPGEWVSGSGWDEGKPAEHRYVTAADLDAVAPNNPVWLIHTIGHYGVANSLAVSFPSPPAQLTPPPAPSTATPTATPQASSKKTPPWSRHQPHSAHHLRADALSILYIQQVLHRKA